MAIIMFSFGGLNLIGITAAENKKKKVFHEMKSVVDNKKNNPAPGERG